MICLISKCVYFASRTSSAGQTTLYFFGEPPQFQIVAVMECGKDVLSPKRLGISLINRMKARTEIYCD